MAAVEYSKSRVKSLWQSFIAIVLLIFGFAVLVFSSAPKFSKSQSALLTGAPAANADVPVPADSAGSGGSGTDSGSGGSACDAGGGDSGGCGE